MKLIREEGQVQGGGSTPVPSEQKQKQWDPSLKLELLVHREHVQYISSLLGKVEEHLAIFGELKLVSSVILV